MEKAEKQKALIGAAVLGVIVIGLLFWYMATHEPAKIPLGQLPGQETPVPGSYEKKTISASERFYDATATYPAETPLKATAGAEADAAAVLLMKSFAENQIEGFIERGAFDTLTQEDIQMLGFDQGRKYTLDMDFEVSESPKALTYVYTIYEDTLGAHPNGYFRTFSFNKSTGAVITLEDLFEGPYLVRLSQIARAELPAMIAAKSGAEANIEYIESGTEPIADSFQNFALQGDMLVLIFAPYQVGPYALGTQILEVPLATLEDVLNPEFLP